MIYFLPADKMWWLYVAVAFSFVVLIMLLRRVIIPSSAAMRGMELIASQDFNNRLTKVGERNADKVVTLFNAMIDKLRNERLRNLERESFLKLLIDASPMGVMMLDFDGKVSMANDSMLKIMGISGEDNAVEKEVKDLPSDLAAKMADVPLGENGIIRRGDVRRYRCYHLSFVQTGFHRHFYLLESLTEEVMKAERQAYEKVIRIISHEVNNTMGGVKSVLDLIYDTSEEDDVKVVIDSCNDRCDKMCSFIRSYADVVKLPDPVKHPVEINEAMKGMLPFLQGIITENKVLNFIPSEEDVVVDMDLSLMQQVIINIVKNAVESIDNSGFIEIRIGEKDSKGWIEISNNGSPISEEVSRQLFSPFFTTKREGRGLGLTLISEILKRHEATYSLRTGQDGITRFHIQF